MAKAIFEFIDDTGTTIQIKLDIDKPIRLGRNPENDIIFTNSFVSKRHGIIFLSPSGGLVYQDLDSTHGSSIFTEQYFTKQNIKLKPNVHYQLTPGTQIMLGNSTTIRFIEVLKPIIYYPKE